MTTNTTNPGTPDPIQAAAMALKKKIDHAIFDALEEDQPLSDSEELAIIATAMRELVAREQLKDIHAIADLREENTRLRERVANLEAESMAYHKACIHLDKFVPFFGVDNCERIKSVANQLAAEKERVAELEKPKEYLLVHENATLVDQKLAIENVVKLLGLDPSEWRCAWSAIQDIKIQLAAARRDAERYRYLMSKNLSKMVDTTMQREDGK